MTGPVKTPDQYVTPDKGFFTGRLDLISSKQEEIIALVSRAVCPNRG